MPDINGGLMRTVELWIDLYAHSLLDPVEAWPVWGQWRCVQDGLVHWQVSGFILDDAPQPQLVTVTRIRDWLKGEDPGVDRLEAVVFPRQLLVGAMEPAGAQRGTTPNVRALVADTAGELAIEERLAIGLTLDPTLAGGADIFPAQALRVPSNGDNKWGDPIAQRDEICIVQVQQIRDRKPKPLIPEWQLVRILEIAPPELPVDRLWGTDLRRRAPMTEIRGCPDDVETVNELLLEFRPHVIISHSPAALAFGSLSSVYLLATKIDPALGEAPYRALCRLLGSGASGVLVVRSMDRASFATRMIEVLSQRGTLADALLELHSSDKGGREVTVCGRDLRLRLRAKDGTPATQNAARGSASAWIPLGDRLRGTMDAGTHDECEVRVVALSGHIVTAVAKDVRDNTGGALKVSGLTDPDLKRRVEERCQALARTFGHEVTGTLQVEGDDVEGLDPTESVLQAADAAMRRALLGSATDTPGYLLVAQDLFAGTQGQPLPAVSPVLVAPPGSDAFEAVGSIPWVPDATRVWRCWEVGASGTAPDLTSGTKLRWKRNQAFWSMPQQFLPQEDMEQRLGDMLEWHIDQIHNLFPPRQYPQASEFADANQILVGRGRLLYPKQERVGRHHTSLVREIPVPSPDPRFPRD